MLAVTTFHSEAGKTYAKTMLEGLSQHFKGKIIAYVEAPQDPAIPGVEYRDWGAIPGATEFIERIKTVPGSDGKGTGIYDYRYDCNRFCRKVFAQEAVFDEDELVLWFDSDCVIKNPFPDGFFEKMLGGVPFAYMGRGSKKQGYTETGWVGFNTKHEKFPEFRSKYLSFFTTGKVFTQLKGWHDCIAFDQAREGIEGKNLSPFATGMNAVIGETVLGKYMEHRKGARKFR